MSAKPVALSYSRAENAKIKALKQAYKTSNFTSIEKFIEAHVHEFPGRTFSGLRAHWYVTPQPRKTKTKKVKTKKRGHRVTSEDLFSQRLIHKGTFFKHRADPSVRLIVQDNGTLIGQGVPIDGLTGLTWSGYSKKVSPTHANGPDSWLIGNSTQKLSALIKIYEKRERQAARNGGVFKPTSPTPIVGLDAAAEHAKQEKAPVISVSIPGSIQKVVSTPIPMNIAMLIPGAQIITRKVVVFTNADGEKVEHPIPE